MNSRPVLTYISNIRCFISGLCIIFFLHITQTVQSQSVRYILTRDGLPQSFISGLVQDDTSFIWIGTRNGLARYDGIQFKVFQHNTLDTTTLASNPIIWIRKDKHNQLGIEHESGEIDVLNPATEKIRHLIRENQVKEGKIQYIRRGWLVDEDGIFWGIRKGAGLNNYNGCHKKNGSLQPSEHRLRQ